MTAMRVWLLALAMAGLSPTMGGSPIPLAPYGPSPFRDSMTTGAISSANP